jgi:hypothetical protein
MGPPRRCRGKRCSTPCGIAGSGTDPAGDRPRAEVMPPHPDPSGEIRAESRKLVAGDHGSDRSSQHSWARRGPPALIAAPDSPPGGCAGRALLPAEEEVPGGRMRGRSAEAAGSPPARPMASGEECREPHPSPAVVMSRGIGKPLAVEPSSPSGAVDRGTGSRTPTGARSPGPDRALGKTRTSSRLARRRSRREEPRVAARCRPTGHSRPRSIRSILKWVQVVTGSKPVRGDGLRRGRRAVDLGAHQGVR